MQFPPPRIIDATLPDGRTIHVIRDDMLPGGSKRRVLPQLFEELGDEEFVFGGPAQGYAQVALGYAATDVGKRSTYFVAKRKQLHPLTAEARAAGARIVEVPAGRLSVVQSRAKRYCQETGARFLPLGFDIPRFGELLDVEVGRLGINPAEMWCVAGSGALSRSLARVWPTTYLRVVRIGFEPRLDPGCELHTAPEDFGDIARRLPPFASCANYDAKAWQFISRHAADGAYFWNVAA